MAIRPRVYDYHRLLSAYRPTVAITLFIAALALALALRQPDPLTFTVILFVAMCGQRAFAVHRWLDTADGRAHIAELAAHHG